MSPCAAPRRRGKRSASLSTQDAPRAPGPAGAVLEGMLDLQALWGTAPASVQVAFAGYGNANGDPLSIQIPCGNGDGNLDAAEWITVNAPAVAVGPAAAGPSGLAIRMLSRN